MSRKHSNFTREILPDPKFHSEMVTRFINMVMVSGKRWAPQMAWSDGRFKAVFAGDEVLLFDLEQDPSELNDCAAAHPPVIEPLFNGAGQASPPRRQAVDRNGACPGAIR